ncbi:MAG: tyrosine-type recombinase/integrase, partial [Actinomycetota bacterium]|nr:tyrosine-type recombinase/integrase [Actinomycetota bacterium]
MLHPLEFAAVLTTARQHSPTAHALVALLGMLGLRVTETCTAQISDLHDVGGYEVLHVLGKGAKPADIPLPIPVLRAVRAATDGRTAGPILQSKTGQALTRGAASRLLARVVAQAGISHPVSPHTLRPPWTQLWATTSTSSSTPDRLSHGVMTDDTGETSAGLMTGGARPAAEADVSGRQQNSGSHATERE